MNLNKIHLQDCLEGLEWVSQIKPYSVDLTVTSPPYKDCDGYSEDLIRGLAIRLWLCHKPNTLCFVNFGHLAEAKSRPFKVCDIFECNGWVLGETFTWVKNHYKPIQGSRRLNNLSEFIFLLHKGKMPSINRLAIGVPYNDKSNVGRFAEQDLKCGGNVWPIKY